MRNREPRLCARGLVEQPVQLGREVVTQAEDPDPRVVGEVVAQAALEFLVAGFSTVFRRPLSAAV